MSINMEGRFEAALARIDAAIWKLRQPYSPPLDAPWFPTCHPQIPIKEVTNPHLTSTSLKGDPIKMKFPNFKEVKLPIFKGGDPTNWILGVEHFFEFYGISDAKKLKYAWLGLSGSATLWYYKHIKPRIHEISWSLFLEKLIDQFDSTELEDSNKSMVVDEENVIDDVPCEKNRDGVVFDSLESLEMENYRSDKSSKVFDELENQGKEKLIDQFGILEIEVDDAYLGRKIQEDVVVEDCDVVEGENQKDDKAAVALDKKNLTWETNLVVDYEEKFRTFSIVIEENEEKLMFAKKISKMNSSSVCGNVSITICPNLELRLSFRRNVKRVEFEIHPVVIGSDKIVLDGWPPPICKNVVGVFLLHGESQRDFVADRVHRLLCRGKGYTTKVNRNANLAKLQAGYLFPDAQVISLGIGDMVHKAHIGQHLKISQDVQDALSRGNAVVALESTIISHGMPYPQNLQTAKEVEAIVKKNGAVPATIAILDGVPCIGLDDDQLERLAKLGRNAQKTARRDIASVVASSGNGATTVSATMFFASKVGIPIFVTGGIGGVHRHGEQTMDISSDLTELGRTLVAVISAGVKSILDIPRTLEFLETQGVTVAAYGTSEFPAFFTESSGCKAPCRLDCPQDCARFIHANLNFGMGSGMLISLRMLHIKKQPWYGRPFIISFQSLLRNTPVGKFFFNAVATPESVKNILCQCYHDTSAGGLAVFQVLDKEKRQSHCADVGTHLVDRLKALQQKHEIIGDVRGRGLMLGVEFVTDRKEKTPAREETAVLFEKLKDLGVLVGKGGLHANVFRIKPPMCFTRGYLYAIKDRPLNLKMLIRNS